MDLGLAGETALVMSSTRGLGLGCARALTAEGVRVVINGRDRTRGAEAVSELGHGAQFIGADITSQEDRLRLLDAARERLGAISILVTNGDGPPAAPFLEQSMDAWRHAFEQIALPAIDLVRQCVPDMARRGFGRVISIGSISGKEITLKGPLANSARPSLAGALGTLAREVGSSGVTVNTIMPGAFDTDALRRMVRQHSGHGDLSEEEAVKAYADAGPMRRLGRPEEIGALCAFLCSRQAGYITGQCIAIDGGRVATLY